jgi:DNA-binding NtrC family response regulator
VDGPATTVTHRFSGRPIRSLRIEVVAGPDKGINFRAPTDTVTVGTAPGNDLVLTDATVSRYHLELRREEDLIAVHDHVSTNGTRFGTVLLSDARIAAGTTLTLGKTQIRVDDGEPLTVELLSEDRLGSLRGRSQVMRALMAKIRHLAESDAPVLLLGETGTGKELIAQAIHDASSKRDRPFETVDCAALIPNLIASELFGHEKGAFTGADERHIGAFERAQGGTVFLDEIGELPLSLQPTLLGVLERKTFRRLGGAQAMPADVRIVAATHRDLRAEVNAGTFRQDLYYRIAVALVRVPPLRERIEDLPLLVEHFLREAGHDGPIREVVPETALEMLKTHRWPGNVRELRNFVEAALAMGETPSLEAQTADGPLFGSAGRSQTSGPRIVFPTVPITELFKRPYKLARQTVLDEFESAYLRALIERSRFNVARAARASQINRSHLTQMLKRHKITRG